MKKDRAVSERGNKNFFLGRFLSLMCLTIVLMSAGAVADPGPQHLGVEPSALETDVIALASAGDHPRLRVTISQPQVGMVNTKGGSFQSLDIAGQGVTAEVGKPKLPVIRRLVKIPFGAEVSLGEVSANVGEWSLDDLGLQGPIVPVQPPVPKIPGAMENAPFIIDRDHYQKDDFWPPDLVRVKEIGVWRQARLALVEIFPVRYNPHRGLIRLCSTVEFDLLIQGGDLAGTQEHQRRYTNFFTTRWTSSDLFIETRPNPRPIDGWSTVPAGYLIIVADELYQAVLPLVIWKCQEGFEVTVVKTSEAGQEQAEIRDFIQDAYENWEIPPTFLLLVGDSQDIPPYTVGGITTDLYYTTMNEEDYFPDIQVGRLAVADSTQLTAVIQKIIGHEMGLWDNDDGWTRRGYFMASNDGGFHDLAEGTQEYSMRLARSRGMTCDSLYAYYGTGTPVSAALNNGRTMAIYTGHGSWYNWQGPTFTQDDVEDLHNGQMFPLVCSHACNTGGFHKPICFGETWLRTPGKGAAAFWGSSVSSYWDEDDILQRSMFDALFDSSMTWLAGMMDQAKLELYVHYGGGGLSENYYQQYNLLGDPSMYLWTRPPKSLVVEYDELVPIGSSSFRATVWEPKPSGPSAQDVIKSTVLVPLEDALVSVVVADERRGLAQTVGGNVSVALNPVLFREEPMEVAVSKRGYRPYMGAAEVKADGPFLIYNHHILDDTGGGNGDDQANAGESVSLTVTIENTGNQAAHGITAILLENDPYVQLGRSSADFGDIVAKGFGSGFPPYEFHISEYCPSGHQIIFNLMAADSTGQRWFLEFQIEVVAADLVCYGHQILDGIPGGNDNGMAEAGETVDLVVILRNQGLAPASEVSARVTSPHSYIEVLSDSTGFGDLAPETQAAGTPTYRLLIDEAATELSFYPLTLDISSAEGYAFVETIAVLVGTPGFSDDMETGPGKWTHVAVNQGYVDHWHLSRQRSYSDSSSWKCGDAGDGNYFHYQDGGLISPPIALAQNSVLTFWHWIQAEVYDARHAWDGGLVEISEDGGQHWGQIAPVGGYHYTIWEDAPSAGNSLAAGTPCFSGSNDWKREEFDLSAYSGLIHLRFRFCSDQYTEKEGWYIDDVKVDAAETMVVEALRPSILLSGSALVLIWAPCVELAEPVRYEVYRAEEPEQLIHQEHLVAVMTQPQYVENITTLWKDAEAIFYSVVAVGDDGRRCRPSSAVGWWRRRVE